MGYAALLRPLYSSHVCGSLNAQGPVMTAPEKAIQDRMGLRKAAR